jgi:hypothetical protein
MASQKYSVNQHLIETLMAWVKSGEIAIPEIQRPFVWDATQVRDLLDSLYQGYPVGYIIVWKNPDVQLKDGSLSGGKKILIDGQQRITALSAALVGNEVINKEYRKVRIRIAFNPKEERFEVSNPAIVRDKSWIPDIAPIMQGEIGLLKLVRQYTEANPEMDEDHLERVLTQLIGITKKQIGMIELAAELDIEMVTEIFIRINREGVTLSQADFAMSKIAANETYGGNLLRKAIDYFCHLAVAPEFYSFIKENDPEFTATDFFKKMEWLRNENEDLYDPTYSDMLRVAFVAHFARGKLGDLVGLLSGRDFVTRTYKDEIAEQSFARLKNGVMAFMNENHFKRFLMILKSAGFVDSSQLQNRQGPLNFAYALYLKLRQDDYPAGSIEHYVRRWFVLSILTGRYSGPLETLFEKDIRSIDQGDFGAFLVNIEAAELSDTFWSVGLVQAMNTSSSNHPAYKAFLAAQVKNNRRGFLSRDITVRSMLEHRGDVHHIFPKNYLQREFGLKRSEYNQIANYVYTQQEINIAVSNQAPGQYLTKVLEQCATKQPGYGGIVDLDDLKNNFEENAVPIALLDNPELSYGQFLTERRRLIAHQLKSYYFSL